jgi:hypothetical protein
MRLRGTVTTYFIPPAARAGFQRLAELPAEDYERLASAIDGISPSADPSVVADRAAAASGLSFEDLHGLIFPALLSAVGVASNEGVDASTFAASLDLSILEIAPDAEEELRRRVSRLLDATALRLSVRSIGLLFADERVLISAQITTDLRPVFPERAPTSTTPLDAAGALVVHFLTLEYQEAGQIRRFTVALDARDISQLREAIERGEQEADTLARLAANAGVPNLSPGPTGRQP